MKVKTDDNRVSIVLIPENDEEKEFLRSWWANAHYGSVKIQYHFRDTKIGSIGMRVFKEQQTILKVGQ